MGSKAPQPAPKGDRPLAPSPPPPPKRRLFVAACVLLGSCLWVPPSYGFNSKTPPRSTPQPPYVAGRPLWNLAVQWQACRVERARKIEERWRAIGLWRAGQALEAQK